MKKLLKEEHNGFAISLEVMLTLCIIFTFLSMFLYIDRIMNLQRYMNTCMTSAAIQASRYGGNNTKAFHENVIAGQTISEYYNNKLDQIAKDYGYSYNGAQASFNLTITPDRIRYDSQEINVVLNYYIPSSFSSYSKVFNADMYDGNTKQITVRVCSIMKAGELLND